MVNWWRLHFTFTGIPTMIYLDNNATTEIVPGVLEVMKPLLMGSFGNPSSSHACGRDVRGFIDDARQSVADLVGASSPNEIVFTSGGTEGDNWAILGALRADQSKNHIVTTRVEHEAVRLLCQSLERAGNSVTWLNVNEYGELDLDELRSSLKKETAIVSIMLANNETGVLFPVAEAAQIVKENSDALFHTDAVNAVGKIAINLKETRVDLLTLSSHKFHGPKGTGAIYIRDGVKLRPMFCGGGQERGRRAGTEATHQIVGMGAAAEYVRDIAPMGRVRELRDRLEQEILAVIPETVLNGTSIPQNRLPNTSNISFANTNGEAILARLDANGVCVSTGSACNSEAHTSSAVLQAMNVPYSHAMGSIRFSLSRLNTEEEIDTVLEILPGIVSDLRSMAG